MERYRKIIDNWQAFEEAVEQPPVKTVRKNHIKASSNFKQELRSEFDEVEQSEWNPEIFRLKDTETPGKSALHWLGEYYVQEESATIPIEILNPQKDEEILDMAAAPGGKSTQIASKIENDGLVVANDASSKRMKSLHANVYRTGSTCIAATNYDGRQFPGSERFDRILVDAPCSGEGDKARRNFDHAPMDDITGLAELQKKLVERASELLKPDGVLVYSTCTFAPEENEEVVEHALENTELELERIELEAPHRRGVTSFQDREYSEEMRKTVRIYPHHLQSGGMYIARFVKSESSLDQVESKIPSSSVSKEDQAAEYLKERFGVDIDELESYALKERSGDVWLVSEQVKQMADDLDVATYGVRAIRFMKIGLKPTTYLLQLLGDKIEKNIVELQEDELKTLLAREDMIPADVEKQGYVALKFEDRIVGCGFYKDDVVSSRVPKGRSKEFVELL